MGLRNKIKGFINLHPDCNRDELVEFLLNNHIEIGDIVEVTTIHGKLMPGEPLHVQKVLETTKGYFLYCIKLNNPSDIEIYMVARRLTKKVTVCKKN